MNHVTGKRHGTILGVVCSLFLLAACATTVSVDNQIEKRVTGRWDSLFSGDLAGAYEYLSPGYRSSVSSADYQKSILLQRVKWTSAEFVESNCEKTVCTVKVLVGYNVFGAVPGVRSSSGTQDIEESWVLVDGEWYLVPKH